MHNSQQGKYIYSTTDSPSHTGAVSLSETASPLTYSGPLSLPSGSSSTATSIYAFIVSSTNLYLSVSSVLGGVNSQLGVHNVVHDGISVGFHTFADLISRYWAKNNIAAEIAKAGQYGYPAINNDYTVALNGVKTALDGGSYTGNATNYNNLRTLYEGFLAAEKVMPTTGFFRIKGVASGRYLTCEASASNASRLGASATAEANTIFYLDGNKLLGYKTGFYTTATCEAGTLTTTPDTYVFNVPSTLGEFSIKGTGFLYSWTTDKMYFDRNGNTFANECRMYVEPVTVLPITMNAVDNKYYGTINLPVAVTIPEGVYAYKAAVAGDVMTLTKVVENGVLAANTPVVLYSASEVTSLAISAEAGTGADDDAFSGTTAAITAPAGTNYVLNRSTTEGVGFYKYTGSVIPGFKAYFNVPSGSPVKGFSFSMEDVETAIRAIESENNDLEIYDIAGRRVPQAQKGLYIVNGKKVMFK